MTIYYRAFKLRHFFQQAIALFLFVTVTEGLTHSQNVKANLSVSLSQPLTIRWRFDSNLTLNLTPAADKERVYLPLAGGTLVSLEATNGQLYWRAELGGELSASPVANEDTVFVASEIDRPRGEASSSSGRGTVRALGREGGITHWMQTLAVPLRGALTLNGDKVFGGGDDGRLYAFDKETGKILWTVVTTGRFNGQAVVDDSKLYVGSEDGTLFAVEENSGRVVWRHRTRGAVRGPVAVGNGLVYFGSGDGHVYAVRADNGRRLWRKRTGAGVQVVKRVDQSLIVASLDNFVYLFSLNGSRLWKRQLPGRISSQPLTAADGALFTPISSPAGVVLGLRDGRPLNSLPTGEDITSSAAPIAVGDAVLLTTGQGLLAFAQPK